MNNRIKTRRFLVGKTQDQLYLETGIIQSKISRIENGFVTPREDEKKALAEALDCTPEELFS